jgi:hypothetical protein
MNQDQIAYLARKARLYVGMNLSGVMLVGHAKHDGLLIHLDIEDLARFATLVEAAYRDKLLAGSGEPVAWLHPANATCVTTDPTGYARGIPLHTADQLAAAVQKEREECAQLCLRHAGLTVQSYDTAVAFAGAIRSRSQS